MRAGRAEREVDQCAQHDEQEEHHRPGHAGADEEVRARHRRDRAKVGPAKEGNELRGKKHQHDIETERGQRGGHRVNHVAVRFHRPDRAAIDITDGDKEDQDPHDKAIEEGRVHPVAILRIAQDAPFGNERKGHQREHTQQRQPRPAQALALIIGQLLHHPFIKDCGIGLGRIIFAQLRLHDIDRHQRTDGRDKEGGGEHEIPVRSRQHGVIRIDQLRGFLRDTRQQRIDRADQQIRAITARYPGKGRRHACQRMAAQRVIDRAAQRDQHDITDFGCGVGDDAGEHDGDRHQLGRCAHHHAAHSRAQQARFLRHAHTQHRHQHDAQRRKAGEIVDQSGKDAPNPVAIHQTDRTDHPVFRHAVCSGRARVDDRYAHPAQQAGQQHNADGEQRKQRDRMRQEVAEPLHAVEEAGEGVALALLVFGGGGGKFGHICGLIAGQIDAS